MRNNKYQQTYHTPYQLKLPLEIEKIIEVSDTVYTFSEVMNQIDLKRYLVVKENRTGRRRFDSEILLKVILFAFMEHTDKLKKYANHIRICGEERNSYSKTDNDATFMRMKKDYMGNDQLLPGYNIQLGLCDEYISVFDVKQYASDMDCFQPLMEKFSHTYHQYPEYPVADAG